MSAKPCRDCGFMLGPQMRGCPRCAFNIEAEHKIERFIWLRLVPGALIGVVFVGTLVYLLR